MEQPWVRIARIALVAMIWLGVFAFVMSRTDNSASVDIAAFIAAVVSTAFIVSDGSSDGEAKEASAGAKAKNDRSGIDPLSLLTPDDVAELREELKHNLRLRMLEGHDGELGSLDALLADQDQRARR